VSDRTVRIVDAIEEQINARRKAIRDSFEDSGIPIGFERTDDETFALFFEEKLNQHPPMELTNLETGQTWIASPWLAALELIPDGRRWIERWEKVRNVTTTTD